MARLKNRAPQSGREILFTRTRIPSREREDELSVLRVDDDPSPFFERPEKELFAERTLHLFLDHAGQRTGAVVRIVTGFGEIFGRRVGQLDRDLSLGELRAEL